MSTTTRAYATETINLSGASVDATAQALARAGFPTVGAESDGAKAIREGTEWLEKHGEDDKAWEALFSAMP